MKSNNAFFLGFSVVLAPWSRDKMPKGHFISEDNLHLTLVFFPRKSQFSMEKTLPNIPLPPFSMALPAIFDKCLLLPDNEKPRVVAWRVKEFFPQLALYQQSLQYFFKEAGQTIDVKKSFLPHVTVARNPEKPRTWEKLFVCSSLYLDALHLYESLGNSCYKSHWQHALKRPFQKIEHAADLAFKIYGRSLAEMHLHAQIALSFEYPEIIPYLSPESKCPNLESIIIELNNLISEVDIAEGIACKAVSFHGNIQQENEEILSWEMIIDV